MSGSREDRDRRESLVDPRKALGRCARPPWLGVGVGHRRLVKKKDVYKTVMSVSALPS